MKCLGVIFALKVLTTHYDMSEVSYLMGIPIGSKYAVWAELVLIQLISPNVSLVGHLAGILVGLAYIYGPLFYVIQSLNGN
jgi:rhomboid domain-containing protein 1